MSVATFLNDRRSFYNVLIGAEDGEPEFHGFKLRRIQSAMNKCFMDFVLSSWITYEDGNAYGNAIGNLFEELRLAQETYRLRPENDRCFLMISFQMTVEAHKIGEPPIYVHTKIERVYIQDGKDVGDAVKHQLEHLDIASGFTVEKIVYAEIDVSVLTRSHINEIERKRMRSERQRRYVNKHKDAIKRRRLIRLAAS